MRQFLDAHCDIIGKYGEKTQNILNGPWQNHGEMPIL